jgi:uncharacterized protein YkwD
MAFRGARPVRHLPRSLARLLALGLLASGCARTARPLPAALATREAAAPPPPASRPPPTAAPAADARRFGPEPAVVLAASEADALEIARRRLGHGGAPPAVSGALVLAARELARGAAAEQPEPLGLRARRAALTAGLAYDPAPAAYLVRGPADRIGPLLAETLPAGGATHVGAGAVEVEGGLLVVVLATERRARLEPFPRSLPRGASARLAGRLAAGLARPRVVVTVPSGDVREAEVRGDRETFEARLVFPEAGEYLVEVVARGSGGPEVAALLTVTCGVSPATGRPAAREAAGEAPEPADLAGAEAAVVRAIGALRARRGLGPVSASPALSAVARAHSAAMRDAGKVSHVLAASGELTDRLRRARIGYRRAYENVARGSAALGAHAAAEESPAHLANLLAPGVTRVGVGVARAEGGAVYLTEILVEPAEDGAASRLTPDARVREVLWSERARAGRPPLTSDLALDALAREAAADLLRRDATEAGALAERALALGRRLAAVDVFVASAPDEALRSANLRDPRYRRVGVGVATGDSARFGAARMFVAVLYTD